ncbi:hypothetical protein [Streptococcus uberis]|uniref:hypothetical protein n=1 Tax=Streptococcus uberis TaxID=1349 RepID=UPI002FECD713
MRTKEEVDQEFEEFLKDIPDFPDPAEMTDIQLLRCRFVNMTIEQNKAVIKELKKRGL